MADTKKTPVFDWDTGQFALGVGGTVKTAVGAEAAAIIAQKALNTQLGNIRYTQITRILRKIIYMVVVFTI